MAEEKTCFWNAEGDCDKPPPLPDFTGIAHSFMVVVGFSGMCYMMHWSMTVFYDVTKSSAKVLGKLIFGVILFLMAYGILVGSIVGAEHLMGNTEEVPLLLSNKALTWVWGAHNKFWRQCFGLAGYTLQIMQGMCNTIHFVLDADFTVKKGVEYIQDYITTEIVPRLMAFRDTAFIINTSKEGFPG